MPTETHYQPVDSEFALGLSGPEFDSQAGLSQSFIESCMNVFTCDREERAY